MKLDSYNDVWALVLEYCKSNGKISDAAYNIWLAPLKLVSFEEDKLILATSSFKANIIRSKFMPLLNEAFEEVIGFPIDIEFVNDIDGEKTEKKAEPSRSPFGGGAEELTFDNFVVGSSNKFAYTAAQSVANTPGQAYNPLFIYGHSGLGKTHLLHAICTEIKKNYPDAKIIYTNGEDFTNELVSWLEKKRSMQQFHDKYRTVDVLLMDDIQFIGGKTQTQEEFFHTFNTLVSANKQIVLTSDRPPKEIPLLEDRIRTRFEWGLIADIQPPDIETRMAIIKRKAEYYNLDLPDEIVQYIAEKIKSNVRQLEGTVKKLDAYYTINGHEINIQTAQKAIKDIMTDNQPVPVTIDKILNEVARTYGVSVDAITSNRRNQEVVEARQIAMYVIREVTDLSMEKIGAEFGNRHHSTIIYSIKEVEKDMETNPSVKHTVQNIINNVNNN